MDSILSINQNGYKVFELVKSRPIIKTTRSLEEERRDNEAGIPTLQIADDSISQFSNLDIFNNNVNIGARLPNEEIIINESDYNQFKFLVEQFLSIDFINRVADYKFIVKVTFDWMIGIYVSKIATVELYDFVVTKIEEKAKQRHYDFIIKALEIQTPFQVGNCHFHQLSQNDSLKVFETTSAEANKNGRDMKLEDWNKIFNSFVNTPLATVTVFGVESKCVELAKKEIRLSVNSLKCFLFPQMLRIGVDTFNVDFDYRVVDKVEYLSHIGNFQNIGFNVEFPTNTQPISIGQAELNKIMKDGLFLFHQFIISKRNVEIYYDIENAIIQFGSLNSFSNLYERIINLISFFETLIIPKNNYKAKGETILKKNVIPKLHIGDQEVMRTNIRRLYDIRDKYVHNRIELAIDVESYYSVTLCGLFFLIHCVNTISTMNTIDDLHCHFDIVKDKKQE
ncbi:hypothetical protein [Flavobacterium geliluteum]|uniref:Apea-like HEPN domain-containing protein n=1 Tax=Flavobacterium geliluteum TaxID=2816120 RepID=A0A940XC71_9FLAO|nr:hypothetical protein [Flavobacterium geliluteum]MBP4136964.1 hypothetical protein [Flavobacterium geliluteum]